jgi:hypothetical protein
MQYMILIYDDERTWGSMQDATRDEMLAAYFAYSKEMKDAGVMRAGDALQPTATATTVRLRQGKRLVTDGPFAETKEQLGGYYLIECKDIDEATKWAAKCPSAAIGSIEVRPVMVSQQS